MTQTAEALPAPQASYHNFGVSSAFVLKQADGFVTLPGSLVNVDVPAGAQGPVLVHTSLDAGIPSQSELRLSYMVNGVRTAEYQYGPANIANATDFWQTRTADALIPLHSGSNRIQIVLRVSSSDPAATAHIQDALITAEAATR